MKLLTRTLSLLTIASLTLFFANCGGDDPKQDPKKVQLDKLSETWVLGEYTYNGVVDGSTQIESDFSITFSGTFNSSSPNGPYNFNVTGTVNPSPLPPFGDWVFATVDGNSGEIVIDGLPIKYTIESSGELKLEFDCDTGNGCGYDGARLNSTFSVDGAWVFTLDPEN